jgi:hypothetical protein
MRDRLEEIFSAGDAFVPRYLGDDLRQLLAGQLESLYHLPFAGLEYSWAD